MPNTFSKYFHIVAANKTCADFLHPGKTCTQALKGSLFDASIGSIKFYFPVCAVPLLLKFSKWNKIKTWTEFGDNVARCVILGFILNLFSFTGICISLWVKCFFIYFFLTNFLLNFSNVFKRFSLPFLIGSAASFGGLMCFIMPPHLLKVEGQGLYNMYVEFLIRRASTNWIKFLRESKVAATLIFSVLHTFVMYGFLRKSSNNFWFSSFKFENESSLESEDKCKCVHSKMTCFEYLKKVRKKYELKLMQICFANNFFNYLIRNWRKRQSLLLD